MFKHEFINLPKILRIEGAQRLYETPDGKKYPSVTTVLGAMTDKTFLDEWRARVGKEEAAKITRMAANRGSKMHSLLEKFILNEDIDLSNEMPDSVDLFKQISPILEKRLGTVYGSEIQLYSDKLKIAGTADLFAEFDGKKAIIDFKNARTPRKAEWIDNYFIQETLYAYMVWERTNIFVNDLVTIIAINDGSPPQVFKTKTLDWIDIAAKMCRDYHRISAGETV